MLGAAEAAGTPIASWAPLVSVLVGFGVIVACLYAFGRSGEAGSRAARVFLRSPRRMELVTGIPGWAASTIGIALYGLFVAGQGFYSDVAWHVAYGRDKELFNAPHTSIVVGLGLILLSGGIGILTASLEGVEVGWRWRNVQAPRSCVALVALGGGAVAGFPIDTIWHAAYGVDVTMWSPPHMLMILGASFTGIAAWLVLAEAGVSPHDGWWAGGFHVVTAWLTLQGLAAPLGEFSFGVPQFQHLLHPLLLCIASGFAFVAIRLAIGRGYALAIAVVNFAISGNLFGGGGGDGGPVDTRSVGVFVASAVAVEAAAVLLGTRLPVRFAIAAGVGVGTVGLAGEWWWNTDAYQPWQTSMLPDAAILSTIAAVGAAIVGAAFGRTLDRSSPTPPLHGRLVAAAAAAVVVAVAIPMPRHVGDVTATVRLIDHADGQARIQVAVTPPDAADHARWFQAGAWQGGGLVIADLERTPDGSYLTDRPVPIAGDWKTLVRLHRGGQLMTVPVHLPADPKIDKPEIPAVERTQPMEAETAYLLRETRPGGGAVKWLVYASLFASLALWALALTLTTTHTPMMRSATGRALTPS